MIASRISAILLSLALSLQLVLAGEGVTCVASRGAGEISMGSGGMVGMSDMKSAGTARVASEDRAEAAGQREEPSQSGPCERAAASTICQLFASCAAGFVAVDSVIGDASQRAPNTVGVAVVITPPSRTIAPELPPPRA